MPSGNIKKQNTESINLVYNMIMYFSVSRKGKILLTVDSVGWIEGWERYSLTRKGDRSKNEDI